MKVKLSKYNYYKSNIDGDFVIFNTKTGAVILGNKCEFDADILFQNTNNLRDDKFISFLLNEGIIVKSDFDELNDIENDIFQKDNSSSLKLTIIPTRQCNFECFYCFAKSSDYLELSESTATNIMNLIEHNIAVNSVKFCKITWFGGEPLLAINAIEDFMARVHNLDFNKNERVKLESAIVTNGYLLDLTNFKKLLMLGVNEFQVTFDGGKNIHDKYRYLKYDLSGSFDVIYQNLIKIRDNFKVEDFHISIRINFSKETYGSLEKLIDKFQSDFGSDSRFSNFFKPIIDFGENCENLYFTKKEARRAELKLFNKIYSAHNPSIYKKHLAELLPKPTKRWCMAHDTNNFVIDGIGNIYSCDSVIADIKERIGFFNENGELTYTSKSTDWETHKKSVKIMDCNNCKRFPICLGGCTRERIKGQHECHWSDEAINDILEFILAM